MKKMMLIFVSILMSIASMSFANSKTTMLISFEGSSASYKEGPLAGTKLELMEFLNPNELITIPFGASVTFNNFESSTIEKITGPATIIIKEGKIKLISGKAIEKKVIDFMPSGSGKMIEKSQVVNFGTVAFRKPLKAHKEANCVTVIPKSKVQLYWDNKLKSSSIVVTFQDVTCEKKGITAKLVKENFWNIPSARLLPGKTFMWNISTSGSKKLIKKGIIKVMTSDKFKELKNAKVGINKLSDGDQIAKEVMEASLYIAFSMNLDAINMLKKLIKDNPYNIELSRMYKYQKELTNGLCYY
ncbi:hypothetical protein [Maridesulfovibrio ferrireducens]|uniref:hypothetical protein n=1 Tax=Maridesulfovibrio ferrireducens TaxID=246191 RepID=UPI001A200593|nr:hypothetical protein [Maridesulfovibrio ferrireducens]MBI9113322.1 hypothetical protein [Maridesulfovibrio ferrireducens]